MKAILLDEKKERENTCYLIKVSLYEYINSIDSEYREYEIQRGIVNNNKYLDKLVETVIHKKHIPVMVLITESNICKDNIIDNVININEFRVLDGLQRTHRLLSIWKTALLIDKNKDEILSGDKSIRSFSDELKLNSSNPNIFRKLVEYANNESDSIVSLFHDNFMWLEVWTGLDKSQQIEKMLLLNAGHKSVNIKHQLELIFLNIIPTINDIAPIGFKLLREKEISSMQYSKTRKVGDYFLPHVISALVSLVSGKPITTNNDFVHTVTDGEGDYFQLPENFSYDLIKSFTLFLYSFDRVLYDQYNDQGILWLGREVAIVGLFGAIGNYADQKKQSYECAIEYATSIIDDLAKYLNLPSFEKARNNVDLGKVNIGNVNKRAIYKATVEILNGNRSLVKWENYFGEKS